MRRERYTKAFFTVGLFVLLACMRARSENHANVSLSRTARATGSRYKYLIFPQGSNVQLIYCLTIGTLTKPEGVFTMGVTAGLAYELPHKASPYHRKPAEVYHRRSRRDLYRKLEFMLEAQGKNGRDCVLKALCQAGKRNRDFTHEVKLKPFLDEILHSIFSAKNLYYRTFSLGIFSEFVGQIISDNAAICLTIIFPNFSSAPTIEPVELEYQEAYNSHDDCDQLFLSCPQIF